MMGASVVCTMSSKRGSVEEALVADHPCLPAGQGQDPTGHRLVLLVDGGVALVDEAAALAVDEERVRVDHHDGLFARRTGVDRLGVEQAPLSCGLGADVERHRDALAAIVLASHSHRANGRTDVTGHHLGVSLEATRGDHHCPR